MSRLILHTRTAEAEVSGIERHRLGGLAQHLVLGLLHHDQQPYTDRLREHLVPSGHYLHEPAAPWRGSFAVAFTSGSPAPLLAWHGREINIAALTVNTITVIGSDPLRLGTRLWAQAGAHLWVDGPDRPWVAHLVREGLDQEILHTGASPHPGADVVDYGWTALADLLDEDDATPAVFSVSHYDPFPNAAVAALPAADWARLDDDARWLAGIEELRTSGLHLQLDPGTWDRYRCADHPITAFDLTAPNWQARLDAWNPAPAAVTA